MIIQSIKRECGVRIMEESKDIARYYNLGTLGSFGMALMDLICKADIENKLKIGMVYPEYLEAHNLWFRGDYKKD